MLDHTAENAPAIKELSKLHRRILGVLVEKAFTTPDGYPLTLKSATTGCNQKSNREPLTNYSEDDVQQGLDQLREMGLVGELHTEGGRTPRYRHYMRQRFTMSEPQLAILTELLLRGRQQLGELRSRASRMVSIETLEQLRTELAGLHEMGLIQSNGPLERRGAEVDHNLYRPNEGKTLEPRTDAEADEAPPERPAVTASAPPATPAATAHLAPNASLQTIIEDLRREQRDLRQQVETLRDELRQLADQFADLNRDLGR